MFVRKMRIIFIIASIVLFLIAFNFGEKNPFQEAHGATSSNGSGSVAGNVAIASNQVAGLASFGFAIAGGLSLLAAAIIKSDN